MEAGRPCERDPGQNLLGQIGRNLEVRNSGDRVHEGSPLLKGAPAAGAESEVFIHFPYAPTLEGQYIIKNMVLISAGLVIGAPMNLVFPVFDVAF